VPDHAWTIERFDLARDLDEVTALDAACFTNPTTRQMFLWEAEKSDVAHVFVMRAAPDGGAAAAPHSTDPHSADPVSADPVSADPVSPDARGPVVAYCSVWLIFDELHINTLAVQPDRRRQGLARRLLEYVFAEAARRGADKATLEVRRSNEAARKLYEGLGFEVGGVRPNYYRMPVDDALILWRKGLERAVEAHRAERDGAA
jgi:ribosomal-protein-alanine acetyltransferase